MNRLLALAVVPVLALTACGGDGAPKAEPKPDSDEARTVNDDYDTNWIFVVVDTPDGPIECMYANTGYKSGGPTCNWEKFNQERAGAGNG